MVRQYGGIAGGEYAGLRLDELLDGTNELLWARVFGSPDERLFFNGKWL
jgi:hypothetical protein